MKRTYLDREEAEDLVRRVQNLEFLDDDEAEYERLEELKRGLGCEHIATLIFHTDPELPPADIVAKALACRPFVVGPAGVTAGTEQH